MFKKQIDALKCMLSLPINSIDIESIVFDLSQFLI